MAEMRNVVLARVDDRLIHGEVVTAWTPTFKANKIIIIDDEVAKDTFNVRVVKALAPAGTKVIVYNVEKAAEKLMVQGVPGERLAFSKDSDYIQSSDQSGSSVERG